ncbi:MAG: DUF3866 family protein [Clostridia bacterium]|nr:DUF3866 family protein [Clostridia bacterium]
MIRIRQGNVIEITGAAPGITNIIVEIDGKQERAVNLNDLTGPVKVGDRVILNTTALYKGLGTGGNHFVMANTANEEVDPPEAGHIMKMRYTPHQVKCLTVDEPDSPYHDAMAGFTGLKKMPVVVGTLHSQLPLIAAGIKKASQGRLRVVYVMTDGAALPMVFSNLVRELKAKGLVDATVTVGHAFGGDYEAINVYTGLIAAREVAQADVTVVTMGPGIVGTGTRYGFTGIEQGEIINAVNNLEGKAIAVPRISFADPRPRHQGVSHHTLTVLDKIALTRCIVPMPKMDKVKAYHVHKQLFDLGLTTKHHVMEDVDGWPAVEAVRDEYQVKVTTMGRRIEEDQEFFLAAGAAGLVAAQMVVY